MTTSLDRCRVLAPLLEEDERLEEEIHDYNAPNNAQNASSKWGFVPGNDDTLDVDLQGHGRLFMGDKTYSKMYADNVTANSLASVDIVPSAEKSVQNVGVERVSFGGEEVNGKGPRQLGRACLRTSGRRTERCRTSGARTIQSQLHRQQPRDGQHEARQRGRQARERLVPPRVHDGRRSRWGRRSRRGSGSRRGGQVDGWRVSRASSRRKPGW